MQWLNNALNFLNKYSDALMVLITFVYVVATIAICRANIKSAKASKEQLEESKRQFEESQEQAKAELEESKRQFEVQKNQFDDAERLKKLPYLIADKIDIGKRASYFVYYITLTNCGEGTLIDLTMKYKEDSTNLIVYESNNHSYVYNSPFEKRFLRVGEKSGVELRLKEETKENDTMDNVEIVFTFKDFYDNCYEQKITFVYRNFEVGNLTTHHPKLIRR